MGNGRVHEMEVNRLVCGGGGEGGREGGELECQRLLNKA